MVRAVLFDLFETLITESGTRPAGVSSLAPELGCDREAFRAQWKARRSAVMVGRVPFREALRDIAASLGSRVEDATLRRICDERIRAKAEPLTQIEPPIVRMLASLRSRGLRLGLVSNCFAEDVVAWPQCSMASSFDCTIFSFEAGLAKPDPEIYLEATRRLRVEAPGTWFIGDGMHGELAGAEQAGLRALRALWFLKRWPHFREGPTSGPILDRVEDLLHIVEESIGPNV